MKDNVLVIAGGAWQAPLIQFLQAKGHFVVVVDPFPDSPGARIADKHLQLDVLDEQAIFDAVKEIPLAFVTTDQSDISVETANNLAQRLGLPANPPAAVKLFVNKYFSRQFTAQTSTPAPSWQRVASTKEIEATIDKIGLPVILKPPDNQASCGIHKIDDLNHEYICSSLADSLAHSRTGYVLCEQYVEGMGITVEGYCSEGKHRSFACSSKDHFPSGVIASLLYPTTVPPELLKQIFAANDRYVEHSGLRFGITHAEYIVDVPNNQFWLVEIACRGGGTLVSSDIAKWVSGVPFYDLLYTELCGGTTDVKSLQLRNRAAYLQFLEFGAGLVEELEGVEDAQGIPGIFQLKMAFNKGDEIRLAANGRTRQGYFIAFGETHEEVREIARKVYRTIRVRFKTPKPVLVKIGE